MSEKSLGYATVLRLFPLAVSHSGRFLKTSHPAKPDFMSWAGAVIRFAARGS
jgi:hypothetical protein